MHLQEYQQLRKSRFMKNFKFTLCLGLTLLTLGLYSCSQDDALLQDPIANSKSAVVTKSTINQSITIRELLEIIKSDCQEHELSFLNGLPKDMQVYIYPKGSKTYPTIKKDEIENFSSLIRKPKTIKTIPVKMPLAKDMNINTITSTKGIKETRSIIDWRILAFDGDPFGYMEVIATMNYVYDINEHVVTEALSIICDLDDSAYIGEYVLDWADKGSAIRASDDGTGLMYNVNGNVILGKTIAGLPAGFVCLEFRGENGEVLVPYSL